MLFTFGDIVKNCVCSFHSQCIEIAVKCDRGLATFRRIDASPGEAHTTMSARWRKKDEYD